MNNNDDVIDDYFNAQLAKSPVNHKTLASVSASDNAGDTVKSLEWFQIHLEHIKTKEDFEEAMELAHVKGFEDGYSAGEEEGYNEGIYSSVVEEKIQNAVKEEQDRIIRLLSTNLGHVDFDDLVAIIEDESFGLDD
jgi:flagellar biosynthesis/type III secretory pathway protein FliH